MTTTLTDLTEGFRDEIGVSTIHDVDERHHQVAVEFPHETLDSYRTDFGAHCFRESFAKGLPPMLWNHRSDELIGRAIKAESLAHATRLIGQFSDFSAVPRAREVFANVRDNILPGWSFHFRNAKSMRHPSVRGATRFTSADMVEFSAVSAPAIPGTKTLALRSTAGRGFDPARMQYTRGLVRDIRREIDRVEHPQLGYRPSLTRSELLAHLDRALERIDRRFR